MSLSDILSSNTTLSIIWLLSNLNSGKYKTISPETDLSSAYTAKRSGRVSNKREVTNISIPKLLNNAELNNKVLKQLNLRHQSRIMYGLTMCYNKQVEFILSDLVKIKQQLFKELSTNQHQKFLQDLEKLKKLRKNEKQSGEQMIGGPFTETCIFDGTREYKTIFELQQLQLQQYGMKYDYKSLFYAKHYLDNYHETSKSVNGLLLKNDETIGVEKNPIFNCNVGGVDYSQILNIVNDVKDNYKIDTSSVDHNKLLIKQSDLSKELNIPGIADSYYLFNPLKEHQPVDQDFESDNDELSNFELSGFATSSNMLESDQFMLNATNNNSKKRKNSFDSAQSDFEIDLINLDSEPPKNGSDGNEEIQDLPFATQQSSHDMDFDLFETNRVQNAETLIEASDLPDESDDELLEPHLSSRPLLELTRNSNRFKKSFKKVKVDDSISFSNTFLRKNNESYEINMMKIINKIEESMHFSKKHSINNDDLIIGCNLDVLKVLTSDSLRIHTSTSKHNQNLAQYDIERLRKVQSHANNENKESDSGSNTDSAVETARKFFPDKIPNASFQSDINVLADLDQINEELEHEKDLMEIDLNMGTSSPKLGALAEFRPSSFTSGTSSLMFSSQESDSFKKTSGDHLSRFQAIEEESSIGHFGLDHPHLERQSAKYFDSVQTNEFLVNRQCMKVYQYVEKKLANCLTDNISLNNLMLNDKINNQKLPRRKTVCRTFYALLQLATRDLITFEVVGNQSPISEQSHGEGFKASNGKCVFISLSRQ